MKITDLPLPTELVGAYTARGIENLYPPQQACVEKGLLTGRNLLVAIPTASGKTLIAEMAMHTHVVRGGRCLYIVPLKALASEKYADFTGKGASVGVATGDLDRRDAYLGQNNIIIATSEKVDSLLRNGAPWLRDVTLLVVDEVHLIDSEDRGPTLEMVITKLRHMNPSMQVIALSATIGNPSTLAGWLDADLVTSDWRPVDLREGVAYRDTIYFDGSEREYPAITKHEDVNLLLDCVTDGGQCLVFVSSRRNAEAYAKRAAQALKLDEPGLQELATRLEAAAETDMGRVLAACVRNGAAFHHAGLGPAQRTLVEQGFREGAIRAISSTPTLAAGLNLPARRVIIRDYLRFSAGSGMTPIPVREYRQMAGRAGRPHLDPYGEAVLIAKSEDAVYDLFEEYCTAPDEDVSSRSSSEGVLTTHILSLIATRFVRDRDGLTAFLKKTFYAHQHGEERLLQKIVDRSTAFLTEAGMITDLNGSLSATEYGELTSRLYIDPRSAEIITHGLRDHDEWSIAGLLQLLCTTPDMYTLYVRKNDMEMLEKFYYAHEDELWGEFSYTDMEDFFRALKTTMLLLDWMEEVGEETVCERYGVGPGDIYNVVDGIGWLVHAGSRLARLMAPAHNEAIAATELRVKHGIKAELIPLVKIRGIGRVRARRLYTNGLTTPAALVRAGVDKIGAIIGRKVAESVIREIETGAASKGRRADRRSPLGKDAGIQGATHSNRHGGNDDVRGSTRENRGDNSGANAARVDEPRNGQASLFSFGEDT
jgi:helicase